MESQVRSYIARQLEAKTELGKRVRQASHTFAWDILPGFQHKAGGS
jgi:hypothetical protein